MPSSGVSDGVQSAVTERYPDAIFCAVETSGDGAVNFYSRVQMFLFKARQRAQDELAATLQKHGVTEDQVRDFVRGTRYASPGYKAPHVYAGTASDLVEEVGPLIGKTRAQRAKIHAGRAWDSTRELFREDLPAAARSAREGARYVPALVRFAAFGAKDALPHFRERIVEIVERLVRTEGETAQPVPPVVAADTAPQVRKLRVVDSAQHAAL
ncbi:MAG: hypothetical protein IT564_12635, partial [Rhodospirillales bacterium]|nr:hypothetical protein [Rhodospirillales bacterium]